MVKPIGEHPHAIPAIAGKSTTTKSFEDTTKGCLTLGARVNTPPHVRKWRKSNYSEPGCRVLHPVRRTYGSCLLGAGPEISLGYGQWGVRS
jgi:hypothetical protein